MFELLALRFGTVLSLQELLKGDDFYRIRLPSNVLNPPGREYIVSSVKAVSVNLNPVLVQFVVCV